MDARDHVIVAWLGSQSPALKRHPLNALAAALAPNTSPDDPDTMIHCELLFPNGHALSIVHNGTVQLGPKNFSRTGWTYRSIPCTNQQFDTMMRFARGAIGDSFNTTGYFMAPCGLGTPQLGFTRDDPGNANKNNRQWYCSSLTAEALACCGLDEDLDMAPHTRLHPHSLWNALTDSEQTCTTAPRHKLELVQF